MWADSYNFDDPSQQSPQKLKYHVYSVLSIHTRRNMITGLRNALHRALHVGRLVPEVDPELDRLVKAGEVNLKTIHTRRKLGLVRLPVRLEVAAQNRIRRFSDKNFRHEAAQLIEIMYNLKPPDDKVSMKIKRAEIINTLTVRNKIKNPETLTGLSEEIAFAHRQLKETVDSKVEEQRRDWHYLEYNDYISSLYMATRLAPNFAVIKTVMQEIKLSDPSFEPKSVMDFGSGMGTTIWAVNEVWPKIVDEFQNIELSKSQQDLCEYLLRSGDEFATIDSNVFHRSYLPVSTRIRYNLVVAAFSLLELPNATMRAQIIENLWHKTSDLLVIIERGNVGGFSLINEARNLILDLSGHTGTKKIHLDGRAAPLADQRIPEAHVMAPCPHEFPCPKTGHTSKCNHNICRFPVKFEPIDIGQRKGPYATELFSYVVIRKKPHPSYDLHNRSVRWPRIIDHKLKSSGMITHTLCCPNGHLAQTLISKRYGKTTYDLAKTCDWGDLMPIKVNDNYVSRSESSFIKKTLIDSGENKS